VFKRPNSTHEISPRNLPDLTAVNTVKLLGVYIDHTMSFHEHVEQIARFYLLQQIRKQRLHEDCLKILFHAIIVSEVLYALSAWGGYISGDNVGRVNKLLCQAKRYSFIDTLLTFPELMEQSDKRLFSRVVCSNHCLYHLLEKDNLVLQMSLRPRGHSFYLPRY